MNEMEIPPLPSDFLYEESDSIAISCSDEGEEQSTNVSPKKNKFCVSSLISSEKCIFFVEFTSGYTFRQFVEFSKRVSRDIPLVFSRRGISTAFCNHSRQLITNAVFRREDLMTFKVNTEWVSSPSSEEDAEWIHNVTLDTIEFFDQIRNLAKKDSVCIYQLQTQPEIVYIYIYGNKTNSENLMIRTRSYTSVTYNIKEPLSKPTVEPNLTISLSKFCGCLSSLVKARFIKISINILETGMKIIGKTSTNAAQKDIVFGNFNKEKEEDNEFYGFNLNSSTINSLIKLSNFNHEGIIRVYCSSKYVLRLEVPIGCYGMARLYIANISNMSDTLSNKGTSKRSNKNLSSLNSAPKAIDFNLKL